MSAEVASSTGYLRLPAIGGETVVFVCEDDLWSVPRIGGIARRLTANLGPVGRSAISPDGLFIAFTGTEEHHSEVYLMPCEGGPARRLTHLGASSAVRGWAAGVRGWNPQGRVLFASSAGLPFLRDARLWSVDPEEGIPERLELGPALEASWAPGGEAMVLGRHTADPARWKRYRGGTRGDIWIDRRGDGKFRRLISLEGNLASPMWVGSRVYFISDHEGIGNIYSCRPDGRDLQRHTDHDEYYARNASSDGERIVYQVAAELWVYDPALDTATQMEIELRSPRVQRNRRFVDAARYLHDFSLHPQGHSVALETRGKLYTMPLWEKAVRQYGPRDGVRHRLPHWTHDGKQVVSITDEGGDEALTVHATDEPATGTRHEKLDLGRALELVPSPVTDEVVLANHRNELIWMELGRGRSKVLDHSPHERISGLAWSPDGRFVAYSHVTTPHTSTIRICEPQSGKVHNVTQQEFIDFRPTFDPEGRYLYFLSHRVLDPVYDELQFDLGFPRTVKPYLVTLRAEDPSPFSPGPRGFGEKPADDEQKNEATSKRADKKDETEPKTEQTRIDFDGIETRVVPFPMAEGRYTQVWGIKGKVLFANFPISGALGSHWSEAADTEPKGKLEVYDLREQKHDVLVQGITRFKVSGDGSTLAYLAGRRLRALKAGDKPDPKANEKPSRRSGWLDLGRLRVSVHPPSEWRQMYREAWRFQKDHFWVADMSGVDWNRVHDRYLPLVEKVTTRLEFSDLMWEMLGELGTSHAYEVGGDIKPPPPWRVGHLAADLAYDRRGGRWSIAHIVRGDSSDPEQDSPLNAPGVNLREGDTILAVGGQPVDAETSPQALLVHQAGVEVELTVADRRGRNPRNVVVRTLREEAPARYREWVTTNRRRVHEATEGRVGYLHIPDMSAHGYAEFHRSYLAEIHREGLIVDVRVNGGGHVSQLLIEKLARDRLGYATLRWGTPEPYPADSPAGPLVCITNELAGSDGDIFTHVFKLKELGPVVGKRTWGGVVGITLRHQLVDNGITTQPEFSFWFRDVGWGVENYGTDPDHDVDIRPQDHAEGKDPQMDKALQLMERALRRHRPLAPDMDNRPRLTLPTLPARGAKKS